MHRQLDRSTRPVKRVRELRRHVLHRLEQRLAKLWRLWAGVSRGVVLRRCSLLVRRDFDSMRVRLRGPDDQSRKLWELRQWMRGSRMSCWGVLGGLWSIDRVQRGLRGFGFESAKLWSVREGMQRRGLVRSGSMCVQRYGRLLFRRRSVDLHGDLRRHRLPQWSRRPGRQTRRWRSHKPRPHAWERIRKPVERHLSLWAGSPSRRAGQQSADRQADRHRGLHGHADAQGRPATGRKSNRNDLDLDLSGRTEQLARTLSAAEPP